MEDFHNRFYFKDCRKIATVNRNRRPRSNLADGFQHSFSSQIDPRELRKRNRGCETGVHSRPREVTTGRNGETMDAAHFAGFWLRHQRIGMRNV
jgi:hypothetical protein